MNTTDSTCIKICSKIAILIFIYISSWTFIANILCRPEETTKISVQKQLILFKFIFYLNTKCFLWVQRKHHFVPLKISFLFLVHMTTALQTSSDEVCNRESSQVACAFSKCSEVQSTAYRRTKLGSVV